MNGAVFVNESLAAGLRKRLLKETGEDFSAALDCLFRTVLPRGCQRRGSAFRRVVAYVRHRFGDRLVRSIRAGAGRRETWTGELLLPEHPDDPARGAFALIRVTIKRRTPADPDLTDVGVHVSQHAVERLLQRRRDGAWDMAALTRELKPALVIAARWLDEHLLHGAGHWQLPTPNGLAFCRADDAHALKFTTWVRADQLRDDQSAERAELLRRLDGFDLKKSGASIRQVCGPRTPAAQAPPQHVPH